MKKTNTVSESVLINQDSNEVMETIQAKVDNIVEQSETVPNSLPEMTSVLSNEVTVPVSEVNSGQQAQHYVQTQQDLMNTSDLGPSLGVYTPESATNSVHSIHGGSFGGTGNGMVLSNEVETGNVQGTDGTSGTPVHTNNVMESPNSISSVDMNNQQVQMQQQMQQQQYTQSMDGQGVHDTQSMEGQGVHGNPSLPNQSPQHQQHCQQCW